MDFSPYLPGNTGVAFSLETDSFIMCLRRFIARRGNPQVLYSDNGTNFVGADRELKQCIEDLNQDQINNELNQKGIKWVFNLPASPHMGGSMGAAGTFV